MLSFRIVNSGTIEIDCDRQGMATLMGTLAMMTLVDGSSSARCRPAENGDSAKNG